MHELSIAQSIVELVEKEATAAGASKIIKVELDIGSMAGVELGALEFAWEVVIRDTIVENAVLQINNIPARAKCKECDNVFDTDNFFTPCPSCGCFSYDIFQGKELLVKAINIEE